MVKSASGSAVKIEDVAKEKIYPEPAEGNIKSAIESFKQLVSDYPQEGESGKDSKYGQDGLIEAIKLAGELNKERTKVELIDLYNYAYPNSPLGESYAIEKGKLNNLDLSGASKTITVNNRAITVKLVSAENPKEEQASAEFSWGGRSFKLGVGMIENVPMRTGGNAKITVEALTDVDKVRVRIDCPEEFKKGVVVSTPSTNTPELVAAKLKGLELTQAWRNTDTTASWGLKILTLKQSDSQCGESLSLENVNLAKVAKIRLIPQAKQLQEEMNITVSIGIEKRAIQLTPTETANRIEKLNQTLNKLDSLNENLKTVVSGLKAACFATSAVLTAKTFLTGLSGEGLARQQVMKREGGWNQKCADEIANSKKSLSQCFSEHADEINKDVSAFAAGITDANSKLKDIEDRSMIKAGLSGGDVVNRSAASEKLIASLLSEHPEDKITLKNGDTKKVSELIDRNSYSRYDVSYEELRDMYTTLNTKGTSTTGQAALNSNLKNIGDEINSRREWSVVRENLASSTFSTDLGLKHKPIDSYGNSKSQRGNYYGGSTTTEQLAAKLKASELDDKEVTKLSANGRVATQEIMYDNQLYLVVLGATNPSGQSYNAKKIYSIDNSGSEPKLKADVTGTVEGNKVTNGISVFNKLDSSSYSNKMLNPEVKYYETDPYKGMPAQVPMDVQKGWYVATKNTIGTTGNIKAFEANGRPSSFWICNVGYNGRIEFFTGMGDDACRQFNLDTGATLDTFPGLSTTETTTWVRKATQALTEAADKYKTGIRSVSIAGQQYNVGSPAIKNSGTQCQDFMDPHDCKLLFNVCDPVICPTSRCDFGGKYPVTDVIQSGIVGSTLLCLPNFPEVKIPICISGIQAGIDSLTSVMRSYRDCLQTSLDTGQTVGICDEMNSIYMCEFFWKQAAPLMNTLIPKAFEMALTGGQGTKGGGEYLTVQGAWDNAKSSMDFFTQSYAVNSVKAFQVRETQDLGGEVCKGFVSLTTPNSLKNLIEPDSPPQFYARFDTTKYSDATVPATSQYKVYYQIYSGQDSGVYYNVYLKGAPTTSYYYSNPTVQVDSGFAAKGQSVSQTRDFTAPEGYKELCVRINDQERCGFSSVSTDFAVNNIKDMYAAEQITKKDITSEQNCISGTVVPTSLVGVAATGANLESVGNGVYNYGVTRVCSTGNPGSTTDVTRFVYVGYCGDTKVRCWLDSRSANAAIGASNIDLRNQTLNDLNNIAIKNLEASGQYLSSDNAASELDKIKQAYSALKTGFNANAAATILYNIDNLWKKLYMNNQKANLLLLKAYVQEEIAKDSAKGILAQQKYVEETKVPKLVSNILKLNEVYDPDKEIAILAPDGKKIALIKGKEVFGDTGVFKIGEIYEASEYEYMTASVIDVAGIYRISLNANAKNYFTDNYVKYVSVLDGAWIKEGQILVDESSFTSTTSTTATTTTPITYSFSLDKVYTPSAGQVKVLDDANKGFWDKLRNLVGKNNNYIGVYLQGDKLYIENVGEIGDVTLKDVTGKESRYVIQLNDNYHPDFLDSAVSNAASSLDGLFVIGNKLVSNTLTDSILKLSEMYDSDKEIAILAPDKGIMAYLEGGKVYGAEGLGDIGTVMEIFEEASEEYSVLLDADAEYYIPDKYAQYIPLLDSARIKEGKLYVDATKLGSGVSAGDNTNSVPAEVYSFSLDKIYSPNAEKVLILDDADANAFSKWGSNLLGKAKASFNPHYIGIYVSADRLYLESSGYEVGRLTMIDNQGSAAYIISVDPDLVDDSKIENYLNALKGLAIVDNKIYRMEDIPKKSVAKPACPSNEFITLKYSGLTNVVDYFGFRCNSDTGKIEVKMIIGKSASDSVSVTGPGTYSTSSTKILNYDWTTNMNGISAFTDVEGGVTVEARDDVTKLMGADSLAAVVAMTKGKFLSGQATISYPTKEYNGFPGEEIVAPGAKPTQPVQQEVKPGDYILRLDGPYMRNSPNPTYIFLNNGRTNVYIKDGIVKVDKYTPQIPDELVLLGTVNTDTDPKIILSKPNPVYPAGDAKNILVDARLYKELNGRRIDIKG